MAYNGLAAFAMSTWGAPVACDGEETTETFSDPDPGLNVFASVVTAGGRLLAIRFSLAL